MIINRNTQLGLMFWDNDMMLEYCDHSKKCLKDMAEYEGIDTSTEPEKTSGDDLFQEISSRIGYNIENKGAEFYTIKNPKTHNFLIQKPVLDYSALIKIKENFSCVVFKNIREGEHLYLLGKSEFFRFVKFNGVIRGMYWNRESKIAFEIGLHLEKDRYYYPHLYSDEFYRLLKLMTYVEIGEVEVVIIEAGRNNGKTKKNGKVTNQSEFTVYVVDSTWNKFIIRTEGFGVIGHFRLQPCGVNHIDRKLIWIDAFEKHGYKRRPKAKILES